MRCSARSCSAPACRATTACCDSLTQRIEHIAVVAADADLLRAGRTEHHGRCVFRRGARALALILVTAIVGKIAGGAAGARLAGYGWRDSLATGALMNARGLMELIVMKIGLDAGLIGPQLFTMLLVMALATTVMTGPLMSWFVGRSAAAAGEAGLARSRAETRVYSSAAAAAAAAAAAGAGASGGGLGT